MHPACFRHQAVTRPARVMAGLAGGAAVALSLGAAAVPAAAHSAGPAAITSLVAQPFGVSVQSAGNAWAVSQGPAAAYNAILHWNGTRWTKMTYPGLANGDLLWAVTALSASDAWAVGNGTDHWDGAHWSQVAAPIPVGSNGPQNLCAVDGDSSSDVWAACGKLILRWDGTSWTRVAPPSKIDVSAVAAISPSDVWLAGTGGAAGKGAVTRAVHWDGTSWTRVHTPSPTVGTNANARLTSVSAAASDDIWAVGTYDTSAELTRSLALHWDGTRWTQARIPLPGQSTSLSSVHAVSPTLAWAVGDYVTHSGGSYATRGLLLQWDGTSWKQVPVPQPASSGSFGVTLTGVSASSASNAWAVGYYYTAANASIKTLMMHWNGTSWTRS
jgi:hypothetical protein